MSLVVTCGIPAASGFLLPSVSNVLHARIAYDSENATGALLGQWAYLGSDCEKSDEQSSKPSICYGNRTLNFGGDGRMSDPRVSCSYNILSESKFQLDCNGDDPPPTLRYQVNGDELTIWYWQKAPGGPRGQEVPKIFKRPS